MSIADLITKINCFEVYADELHSYSPTTGEVWFNNPASFKMRKEGDPANIVGHYAAFRVVTGLEKSDYMTTGEVMYHAQRYSRVYHYDLKDDKQVSLWSRYPVTLGNKMVLLRLLRRHNMSRRDFIEIRQRLRYAKCGERQCRLRKKQPMAGVYSRPDSRPGG